MLDHDLSARLGQRHSRASAGVTIVATEADRPENAYDGQVVYVLAGEQAWAWENEDWVLLSGGGTDPMAFYQDSATLSEVPGKVYLSYVPAEHSEHLYWNGVYQPSSTWSRVGAVTTLTNFGQKVGDQVTFEYAYTDPASPLRVPIGYIWKYQGGLAQDAMYAQPEFDDSAWPSGPTPFYGGVYAPGATYVNFPLNMWSRINVTTTGLPLTFFGYVDNYSRVYLDGQLVWSVGFTHSTNYQFVVPCSAGDHVIAVNGWGDGNVGDVSGFSIYEE